MPTCHLCQCVSEIKKIKIGFHASPRVPCIWGTFCALTWFDEKFAACVGTNRPNVLSEVGRAGMGDISERPAKLFVFSLFRNEKKTNNKRIKNQNSSAV